MTSKRKFRLAATLAASMLIMFFVVGTAYGWTLALGCLWFGSSFVALVYATMSLRSDMVTRFPET